MNQFKIRKEVVNRYGANLQAITEPRWTLLGYTANEGSVRIQYKCLVRFMFYQKWNCLAYLFSKQNYNVLYPNFHIHLSVSDLYKPRIRLPILLQPIGRPILGIYKSQIHECRKWDTSVKFYFSEYINLIFGAVYAKQSLKIRIRIRIFIYPQPLHNKMFIHA